MNTSEEIENDFLFQKKKEQFVALVVYYNCDVLATVSLWMVDCHFVVMLNPSVLNHHHAFAVGLVTTVKWDCRFEVRPS